MPMKFVDNFLGRFGYVPAVETVKAPEIQGPPVTKKNKPYLVRSARSIKSARTDRLTTEMPTTPQAANEFVTRYQKICVARARWIPWESGYATKFKKMCVKNIVGHRGIQLQAQARNKKGKLDTNANLALEAAWKRWGKRQNCDRQRKHCFRNFENLAVISMAENGEFMFEITTGSDAGDMQVNLKVLDPVYCPADYNVTRWGDDGGYIWNGVEFDSEDRVVAYHFLTGMQNRDAYISSFNGRPYIRKPASMIIHGFEEIFVHQTRGFPWLTSGIFNLSNLGEINTAALSSIREQAYSAGFLKPEFGDDIDPDKQIDVKPLEYNLLPPGVDVEKRDIKSPDQNYINFNKENLHEAASGGDVSYNYMANDFEKVNYSSLRAALLGERDGWMVRQEDFIENFHEQIYDRWLPWQLLLGNVITTSGQPLAPSMLFKYEPHFWQARRWPWVDPLKEVMAETKSLDYLLKSNSQSIREKGRDPETVYAEFLSDYEKWVEMGIPEEKINFILSGGKTSNDAIIGTEEDQVSGSGQQSDSAN